MIIWEGGSTDTGEDQNTQHDCCVCTCCSYGDKMGAPLCLMYGQGMQLGHFGLRMVTLHKTAAPPPGCFLGL
jgi:hypothetical protein